MIILADKHVALADINKNLADMLNAVLAFFEK